MTLLSPLKVVQSGGKNIELAVMRRDQPLKVTAAPLWPQQAWGAGGVHAPGRLPLGALKRCPQLWGPLLPSGPHLPRGAHPQGQLA